MIHCPGNLTETQFQREHEDRIEITVMESGLHYYLIFLRWKSVIKRLLKQGSESHIFAGVAKCSCKQIDF